MSSNTFIQEVKKYIKLRKKELNLQNSSLSKDIQSSYTFQQNSQQRDQRKYKKQQSTKFKNNIQKQQKDIVPNIEQLNDPTDSIDSDQDIGQWTTQTRQQTILLQIQQRIDNTLSFYWTQNNRPLKYSQLKEFLQDYNFNKRNFELLRKVNPKLYKTFYVENEMLIKPKGKLSYQRIEERLQKTKVRMKNIIEREKDYQNPTFL